MLILCLRSNSSIHCLFTCFCLHVVLIELSHFNLYTCITKRFMFKYYTSLSGKGEGRRLLRRVYFVTFLCTCPLLDFQWLSFFRVKFKMLNHTDFYFFKITWRYFSFYICYVDKGRHKKSMKFKKE